MKNLTFGQQEVLTLGQAKVCGEGNKKTATTGHQQTLMLPGTLAKEQQEA